jgi:hypothetical protein
MSVSVVHVIMINVVVVVEETQEKGGVIDSVVEGVVEIDLHGMIMIEDHRWYKILVSHQRL